MKTFKFLRNSAGISMVEVMMAVSVMGGLSLTVAQLMKNTSESTKQNEAKQENVNLKALVQNNLGVPQACKNTFGALITQANLTAMTGTGTVAVPNIRNKVSSGTILYSSTTNLQPLTITTMVLTNYVAGAGTADLVINANFKNQPIILSWLSP
jgi:fructose-specific phosphotransferase system IIC component